MQSSFDIQLSYINELIRHCNKDSQLLAVECKNVRVELEHLNKHIESKLEAICKQIEPRIEHLQKRIQIYWDSVQAMDQQAWRELKEQQIIFQNCRDIVDDMQGRVTEVNAKI